MQTWREIRAELNVDEEKVAAAERRMRAEIAEAAEREAVERYREALAAGLSDYEAREEGWPSGDARLLG